GRRPRAAPGDRAPLGPPRRALRSEHREVALRRLRSGSDAPAPRRAGSGAVVTRSVTAVLVEDEVEARRNLTDFLDGVGWIEVVGEARDGHEAIEVLERLKPDLVLLDVRLPEMDGLRVLERLRHAPEVIFTTAYDEHALAAFEIGALDYLVKPFGKERLVKALERIRRRFSVSSDQPAAAERLSAALGSPPIDRLYARDRDR